MRAGGSSDGLRREAEMDKEGGEEELIEVLVQERDMPVAWRRGACQSRAL